MSNALNECSYINDEQKCIYMTTSGKCLLKRCVRYSESSRNVEEKTEETEETKELKKLFVSCPMRNKTPEQIRKTIEKLHKIAETILEENLELVNPYDENYEKNKPIKNLGKSIMKMQEADYFIGFENCKDYSGCYIESEVARSYMFYKRTILLNEYYINIKDR